MEFPCSQYGEIKCKGSIKKIFLSALFFTEKYMGYPHSIFYHPAQFNLQKNTGGSRKRLSHWGKFICEIKNFMHSCTIKGNHLELSIQSHYSIEYIEICFNVAFYNILGNTLYLQLPSFLYLRIYERQYRA